MKNDCFAVLDKLKEISRKAIASKNYDKALAAVSVGADILYTYNQVYTDGDLEQMLLEIGARFFEEEEPQNSYDPGKDSKTVLFYDGFGLDTRGLALIFLKGLARCGYRVIYVTKESAAHKQPAITAAVKGYPVEWVYVPTDRDQVTWAKGIYAAFEAYKPHSAFFYTTPFDVAAAIVFAHYEGRVHRYQVDLTDHAFWLGKNAFDCCLELREVGAKISYNYRGIPREKLAMLPYYAAIDYDAPFLGFPFPTEGFRIIFSGGSLYKTLGDEDNTYYDMVDTILKRHEDIIFLYAGYGDDSQLKKILEKYPSRAYHIAERTDLYQVMRNSVLYLNTYPMFGGLMMNYAASAGRLPLTLKHNHDADGLLFNQENLGIEYNTKEELLEDIDRLLSDPAYLEERERRRRGSVITQERFARNLELLVEIGRTEFKFSVENIDTEAFRKEYLSRFRCQTAVEGAVFRRCNRSMFAEFPAAFLRGGFKWIIKQGKNKIKG